MAEDTEREHQGEDATTGTDAAARSWPAFPPGLSLELVYAAPPPGKAFEDLAEPFVPLGDRGRFSRALAARVTGPTGGDVRTLALKIQSDDYPIGALPGWSNEDVDAQWDEQYALIRAAAADSAAPALIDVLAPAPDGGPTLLPPTLFCKLRRAFFVAPCPACGEPLRVCRDNALLEAKGLPRYDGSLERFLYCPPCSAQPEHRFYALILGDPGLRQRAPVGEQSDLFAALAKLAREGGALPCYGCPNVPTCYPAAGEGEALRYLTPLSFYDFRICASERLDLHLDEFVALLGGKEADGAGSSPHPRSHTRSFLFENDPRGRLPLEILRLKLLAFTQVVAAVAALHRTTRRPHLSLSPENIMVRLGSATHGLPILYRFDVRLVGIGSTVRRKLDGLDGTRLAVPLLMPPPFRDDSFASSMLESSASTHEGALSVTGLSTDESGGPVIEADLTSDGFDLSTLSTKDALHINVRQGRPLPLTVELLANPTRIDATTVRLCTAAVRADPSQLRQVEALVGHGSIRAAFMVYPCLHAPCDIESLGLLLFAILAGNSEQKPAAVVRTARSLRRQLTDFQQNRQGGAEALVAAAAEALQRAEQEGPLAPRHLFHNPADFPDEAASSVAGFWHAALLLALRALTRAPGFGFCRAHDDFDPAHPEGPADHLRSELDILGHRMEEELLAMQGRRREIGDAIKRVRQRLAGGQAGAAGRAER